MQRLPPTPFLVIHESTVRRNLARMAEYAESHDLNLRPHTKTHKSQRLAAMQCEAGAGGLTVAKVGEAEVMAAVEDDLLVAYPTVDRARTDRLARMALHKTIRVAVDSAQAVKSLSESALSVGSTLGVLVDVDVGFHRTGVQSADEALVLAQKIDSAAGVRLDGIFCFPGHVHSRPDQQEESLDAVSAILAKVINHWAQHGLEPAIVSGGSTPSAFQSHLIEDLTEIRPGTYAYYDMNCVHGGFCTLDDCAARIVATVVSDAVPDQFVIDAGSKTLTQDRSWPDPEKGFGHIVEYPDARIVKLTEEHGQVDVRGSSKRPKVGEQVTIIPNHICPCVNLQDAYWWLADDGQAELFPVDARGKLS